jgi:hypothetical protein
MPKQIRNNMQNISGTRMQIVTTRIRVHFKRDNDNKNYIFKIKIASKGRSAFDDNVGKCLNNILVNFVMDVGGLIR